MATDRNSNNDANSNGETVHDPEVGRRSGKRPEAGDATIEAGDATINDQNFLAHLSELQVSETSIVGWQSVYAAALREPALQAIPLKIAEAESAILKRMKQIFYSAEFLTERRAIEDAWETLAQLKVSCGSGTDSPRPALSVSPNKKAAA
jgi:hypothetical protein